MPAKMPSIRGLRLDVGLQFDFKPSIGISAKNIDRLGMDIRSFREPLKRSIQQVMAPSFKANFRAGGRPQRWTPLADDTVKLRGSASPVLIRSGLLMKTIQQFNIWSINQTQAAITDLPAKVSYGKVHQAGYGHASKGALKRDPRKGAKSAAKTAIPARPFVLIQDPEDYDKIEKVFQLWFLERMQGSGAYTASGR